MTNDSPSSLKLDPDIIDALERGAVVSITDRVQPAPMPLAAEASADPASPSALARLAEWDEGRGVPRMAIWTQTGMTLLLIGWGAVTGRGFSAMVDFLSPVFWLFLTLTGVALVVLRRSRPDVARPYRVPLFPFTPLAFAAGSAAVLMSSIGYVGLIGCGLSFGMLALGLVLRAGLRSLASRRGT